MNVSIGDRFKHVIAEAVESGNYSSPEDVVTEAMRLFARRHEDYMALKASIAEALADPRVYSPEEVDVALAAKAAELRARGIPG
jgi:putative addiction module CopG family antidote